MAKQACAICGTEYDEGMLLYSGKGMICAGCESDAEEDQQKRTGVWGKVIGGPITALTATFGMFGALVPFIGIFFLFASPFFGVLAVIQGARSLALAFRDPDETGVEPNEKAMLMISGAITVPWAVVVSLLATVWVILAGFGMLS